MASIREVMAAGVPARLARMIGQNRLRTVVAAGSSRARCHPADLEFRAGRDDRTGQASASTRRSAAALTALYNVGPGGVMIYPAEDEALNDLDPDLPVLLPEGDGMLAVPAVNHWLAIAAPGNSGAIGEAPLTGQLYARQSGLWTPVPAPGIYDAPFDGTVYGAEGLWVTVPDAPGDALMPARARWSRCRRPARHLPMSRSLPGGGDPIAILSGIGRVYVTTTDFTTLVLPLNDCLVIDRSGDRTNPIVVRDSSQRRGPGLAAAGDQRRPYRAGDRQPVGQPEFHL